MEVHIGKGLHDKANRDDSLLRGNIKYEWEPPNIAIKYPGYNENPWSYQTWEYHNWVEKW